MHSYYCLSRPKAQSTWNDIFINSVCTGNFVSVARRLNLHGIKMNKAQKIWYEASQSPEGSIYMES